MTAGPVALDLESDVVELTRTICDIPSVSGSEAPLADAVESALRGYGHLDVLRDGDAVVARTSLGRASRVVIAGHLDTVPIASNLPVRVVGSGADAVLHGRGTVDMKGGVAVQLHLAATVPAPVHDVTWVFYDNEEVEAVRNGLGRLARERPELLAGDFAVLCEPSNAAVEGGCQGTLRVEVSVPGVAAHSARSWKGVNAIHGAAEVLQRLVAYEAAEVPVDGLVYREGLNAVGVRGGIAGNVIPDSCVVTVNYRFAPDKSLADAEAHVRSVFSGFALEVVDASPAARPGLDRPAAAAFVRAVGGEPKPKFGWTDVARFAEIGVPAVNFGPGDPELAHTDDEHCPASSITACERALRAWLTGRAG
ncbi:succinyl-diaminopimelate desuccinylase [Spongisporangium articulatum]|uniref:Succinyl-diaminopimelate desuccinylase n=1 Tax=Spongisporangium articulatum TaxID=3362603 RepID=A0ABW8AQ67_9ACTN